jgi:tRNA 2-thiouridine synthesizing protein A
MATIHLDTNGLDCPLPILKIATIMPRIKAGDLLEVTGDCKTFDEDIRKWCRCMGKVMVLLVKKDHGFLAQIQF